ncbi:hypothetical protein Q3G72_013202 [Acer saccharum]|nr:hypothetical protein Q3G72_013202 [Acer saccharum]
MDSSVIFSGRQEKIRVRSNSTTHMHAFNKAMESSAVFYVPISMGFLIVETCFISAYYISTARELARMVGIRKVPISHHFSESISGVATIRCFNQEDLFLRRSLSVIDDYSRIAFHNSGTMERLANQWKN